MSTVFYLSSPQLSKLSREARIKKHHKLKNTGKNTNSKVLILNVHDAISSRMNISFPFIRNAALSILKLFERCSQAWSHDLISSNTASGVAFHDIAIRELLQTWTG